MMNRLQKVLTTAAALVVLGGVGAVWATSSTAAGTRFVTATSVTGEVSATYLASGTISRVGNVAAAFSTDGTITQILAGIGDEVSVGDVIARLDTTSLKLALLNAETDLAQAKADLYAAKHPGSSQNSSQPSGSNPTSSTPSTTPQTPQGISATDAAKLYQAIAAVNTASAAWTSTDSPTTCDRIYAALTAGNPDPEPSTEPTTGPTSEPSPSPTPSTSESTPAATETTEPESTPTTEPEPAKAAQQSEATGTSQKEEETESDPATIEQLSITIEEITAEDISACGEARTTLALAQAVLADYYTQLVTTGTITDDTDSPAPSASPSASTPGAGGSKSSSSGSSQSSSSSASAIASAETGVLEAEQALEAAQTELDAAELTAPISGTIGASTLVKDASSSGTSVTIVGDGVAEVSIEVPLATRTGLSQGMTATLTPAGSMTTTLEGTLSRISLLETDGTAGESPTYTTVISVSDPEGLLSAGAKASVAIRTDTASDVVTVPVSAVTPTGDGTGTVSVLTSGEATEVVEVGIGVVGGGRAELTSGLAAGQEVVLSDRTAAIETSTSTSQTQRAISGGGGGPR